MSFSYPYRFMKPCVQNILRVLLAVLVAPTFYLIFNAGNPNAFFRPLFPDPSYDILAAVILSVFMAAIGIMLSHQSTRENSIEHLLDINKDHIAQLRNAGKTDHAIAEEFLRQIQVEPFGALYKIALKRVLKHLEKMNAHD